MTNRPIPFSILFLFPLFLFPPHSFSEGTKLRLNKPEKDFFFYQLNLHGGYDSAEPGDGWGLADRGSRSQVSFEWFSKAEKHMQRNYTPLISPTSWDIKFSIEADPDEADANEGRLRLRMLDAWIKMKTKWDRTTLWLGHRSYAYGHNPKLDPDLSFMPNQSGFDFGFGKDTGIFLKTPVSESLDLEFSTTAGGYLSGNPFVLNYSDTNEFDSEEDLDYNGSWLVTTRLGSPTYKVNEFGIFTLGGKLQNNDNSLITTWRIGADWVHKHRESWKFVNQFSVGENEQNGKGRWGVYNLLTSYEWFLNSNLRLGITNTLRYEDIKINNDFLSKGTMLATISYAITRDIRIRVNPFVEYLDSTEDRDSGVLLQFCTGCGLKK